jgi:broad specificity phosphatase PhoE
VNRLLLVRHGATPATEAGRFGRDEPLTDAARADAVLLGGSLPSADRVVCSPRQRCRQTAAAAGFPEPTITEALSECSFGRWEIQTYAEISANEPDALARWLGDPTAAPHGGESLVELLARVDGWLRTLSDGAEAGNGSDTTMLAFTHSGTIKAAVLAALGAPLELFWKLSIAQLSITELRRYDGRWVLERLNWTVNA